MLSSRLDAITSLLFLASALPTLTSGQQCIYPDHNTVSADTPCNTTATHSACCNIIDICLGNGLCFGNGIVSRGSCTDATWTDEACATVCKNDTPASGSALTSCGRTQDYNFVCGFNASCTSAQNPPFPLSNMEQVVLRPAQASSVYAALGTDAPTSSSSPTSGADTGGGGGLGYSAGAMAGVGVGVGVPLMMALAAALFLLRREKKRNAALAATSAPAYEFGSMSPGQGQRAYAKHAPENVGGVLTPRLELEAGQQEAVEMGESKGTGLRAAG